MLVTDDAVCACVCVWLDTMRCQLNISNLKKWLIHTSIWNESDIKRTFAVNDDNGLNFSIFRIQILHYFWPNRISMINRCINLIDKLIGLNMHCCDCDRWMLFLSSYELWITH